LVYCPRYRGQTNSLTIAQISGKSHALLVTRIGVVSNWKYNDTMSLTLINNSIDNSTISHIQLCPTSHDAWNDLIKLFESQDVVTKMHLKNKLHTLKMKENENMMKHIHVFCAHQTIICNLCSITK